MDFRDGWGMGEMVVKIGSTTTRQLHEDREIDDTTEVDMNTLADKLLHHPGPLAHLLRANPGASPSAPEVLVPIPVIVADAVAEHQFSELPVEDFDFRRDFPDLTPRFAACFVEMGRPSRIFSAAKGINSSAHLPRRWGWRFDAASRADMAAHLAHGVGAGHRYHDASDKLIASGRVDSQAVAQALRAPDPYAAGRSLSGAEAACLTAAGIAHELDHLRGLAAAGREPGRLGWLLLARLVVDDGEQVVGPVATADMPLDRAGRVLLPPLVDFGDGGAAGPAAEGCRRLVLSLFFPALLALSFLNCSGVTLRPFEPDLAQAQRWYYGPRSPIRYFILDLGTSTGPTRN
jgi:hypothetical protein